MNVVRKKNSLGKGLSALFGEDASHYDLQLNRSHIKYLSLDVVHPNKDQPRRHFDETALQELSHSIEKKGILQPILVRKHPNIKDAYQIIAGERRFRAARQINLEKIPVIIKQLSDTETLEIALIENIIRQELSAIEEAEGYQRLITEFNYTQEKLAQSIQKSRSAIANSLRLLSLPEDIKEYLRKGHISAGHARALLKLDDQKFYADKIINEKLSVREIEKISTHTARQSNQLKERKNQYNPSISPKVENIHPISHKSAEEANLEKMLHNFLR